MPQLEWFIDDIQDESLIVGIRPTRQGEGVSIVLNAAKSQQLCDALRKAIQEEDDAGDGSYVPRSQAILMDFYTAAQNQPGIHCEFDSTRGMLKVSFTAGGVAQSTRWYPRHAESTAGLDIAGWMFHGKLADAAPDTITSDAPASVLELASAA